jgi:hypothetical protein
MQGKLHVPTLKEQAVAGMFKINSNSVLRNRCLQSPSIKEFNNYLYIIKIMDPNF